jgi:hypothetical protein
MLRIRNYFIVFVVVFAISSAYAVIGVQDAKAQSTMGDLIKRIEALESKGGGGNVTAPKIKGIKIGGSIRHRFELQHEFGNFPAGGLGAPVKDAAADDYTEDFTVQRVRLYFDLDVNENVRGFIKFQDVRTWGFEETQNTPNSAGSGTVGNLGRVDLLEGYAEVKSFGFITPALENVSARVGRWQWFYGDHRLIGHLNWANQGRSYDGMRVKWKKDGNWIDLFGSQIDERDTGSDAASGESDGRGRGGDHLLWGFYSHFNVTKGLILEPYMINRFESRDRNGNEGAATNGEHRWTFGARIAGKKIPSLPGVDFKLEQMLQTGDTELTTDTRDRDIDAFAGAWGAGYTFSNVAWSPRVGYQYAYAEGDDNPTDNDNDTFDHLFPTGHARLGYMDVHGFQNIQAHKIELAAKPTKKLLLKADLWFFKADEEVDNWYGVVGGSFGAGNTARKTNPATGANITDDEYGQEIDLVFKYKLLKNFGLAGGYSHYFVDDWIEDFRGGDDSGADWFWLQTTLKF